MTLGAIWLMAKVLGGRALGLLARLPASVWYVLGALVLLGYFAHWNADRGRAEVEARVAAERLAERIRVQEADMAAIAEANERALAAERLAAERERMLQDVVRMASSMEDPDGVCIPADIADGLRDLR